MQEFIKWIIANKAAVIASVVIFLKWVYNSLPAAGQPFVFSQFFRLFLGEVVQEAPADSQKLTLIRKAPNAPPAA